MHARAAVLLLALALSGCSLDGDESAGTRSEERPGKARRETPARQRPLAMPPCPAGLSGCRQARGRIVYVERVDPDGDGDAHFVLASRQGVTSKGLTVVDVRRDLRPKPLPGIGDELSAAGQVQTGSYGQRQIHAEAVRVRRRDPG